MNRLRLILALLAFAANSVLACTIFILTDEHRALFCNNEDWFTPASPGLHTNAPTVEFARNESGRVTHLVMHQHGRSRKIPRISN